MTNVEQAVVDDMVHHMATMHGTPMTRLERWVDWSDPAKGLEPLPYGAMKAKHDFDHSAGFKWSAHVDHVHHADGTIEFPDGGTLAACDVCGLRHPHDHPEEVPDTDPEAL